MGRKKTATEAPPAMSPIEQWVLDAQENERAPVTGADIMRGQLKRALAAWDGVRHPQMDYAWRTGQLISDWDRLMPCDDLPARIRQYVVRDRAGAKKVARAMLRRLDKIAPPPKTGKRPCYDRDHAWLGWDDAGMTPAKIRDRWNREHPEAQVGKGQAGRDVVKKGIQAARKERDNG